MTNSKKTITNDGGTKGIRPSPPPPPKPRQKDISSEKFGRVAPPPPPIKKLK